MMGGTPAVKLPFFKFDAFDDPCASGSDEGRDTVIPAFRPFRISYLRSILEKSSTCCDVGRLSLATVKSWNLGLTTAAGGAINEVSFRKRMKELSNCEVETDADRGIQRKCV